MVFQKNRYLIFASTIGIMAVVCLMLLYRQLTLSTLLDHETRANVALTAVFSNSIWPAYRQMLAPGGTAAVRAAESPEIRGLHADVRHLMNGSKVVKVKIYSLDGLTIYSSDPSQIGQDKSDNGGFIRARAGQAESAITFRDEFDAFEGRLSDINVVSSYIPIRQAPGNRPEAVFEVYSDVTELVHRMRQVQWQIVLGVLGSVALIYGLLMFAARRADRAEARRREEAARSEAQLHYQAYHDPLTELPNRTSFHEALDKAVKRAERQGTLAGVLCIDVDRFKLVNDSLGHSAGDALLRKVAARLRYCVRDGDAIFRIGGDEFTVLAEGLADSDGAMHLAQRLLDAMREPLQINDQSIISTMSIGISLYPTDDVSPVKLLKNADAALSLAKEQGRNRFRFYTPELNAHALERLALESALQQALGQNEFVLYYQPRLAGDGQAVVAFEALLRWRRNDRLLSPAEFMSVLEQVGPMTEVGLWVLREACTQCVAWETAGYVPVRVSVNVSPRQFRDKDFLSTVTEALAESGLPGNRLELELTESALLDNPDEATATMHALKTLGVAISLDDFGTGYSSFSYLKHLPVDYLKIDRSFVREIDESARDSAIVAAIAGVAHSLGIGLVAEGVERTTQAARLTALGCHELQGFLYARPIPPTLASEWLTKVDKRRRVGH